MKLSEMIGAVVGFLAVAAALFRAVAEAGLATNHNETLLRDRG
jgi:hypothetical protein